MISLQDQSGSFSMRRGNTEEDWWRCLLENWTICLLRRTTTQRKWAKKSRKDLSLSRSHQVIIDAYFLAGFLTRIMLALASKFNICDFCDFFFSLSFLEIFLTISAQYRPARKSSWSDTLNIPNDAKAVVDSWQTPNCSEYLMISHVINGTAV